MAVLRIYVAEVADEISVERVEYDDELHRRHQWLERGDGIYPGPTAGFMGCMCVYMMFARDGLRVNGRAVPDVPRYTHRTAAGRELVFPDRAWPGKPAWSVVRRNGGKGFKKFWHYRLIGPPN